MPRLSHGENPTIESIMAAQASLNFELAGAPEVALAVTAPVDLRNFGFLFPDLQNDPANLLAETAATRNNLVRLGASMLLDDDNTSGDGPIPAIYTYFGQFVDHDATFEVVSDTLTKLDDLALAPLSVQDMLDKLKNTRTGTLELDSLYDLPAPTDGEKMLVGAVSALNATSKPLLRPPGKDDFNDLPRREPSGDQDRDREALIGDPRNDENTIVAQLHTAFLRAHNALVTDHGMTMQQAKTTLRQHYQWVVLHDFVKRICGQAALDEALAPGGIYDGLREPFFMPFEFSVAAYRFGHSMIRANYDFNLNFNRTGAPGTVPGSLALLFTFTAFHGDFGPANTPTLPENWIVEWKELLDNGSSPARVIDTVLVEPLAHLRNAKGIGLPGEMARLAVRNLLRGYLLRMPTGQAVAQALGVTPLTSAELIAVAEQVSTEQRDALTAGGFDTRTPLWYYILAEAQAATGGVHLGPVGGKIVAKVIVELVRRSEDSILRYGGWSPTLPVRPGGTEGEYILADLLALAGVL